MSDHKLDGKLFYERINTFYNFWKKDATLKSTASVLILNGNQEVTYSKTLSLQIWLFGYELPESALLFTKDHLYFLSSKKKCDFLRSVQGEKENVRVELLERDKSDKDRANFARLLELMKSAGDACGFVAKDKPTGDFAGGLMAAVKGSRIELRDVAPSLSLLLAVKDEAELQLLRKSGEVARKLFADYLRKAIIDIVADEKKVKHSKISADLEAALKKPKYTAGLDADYLDICYPPIIQSGGQFKLKYSIESNSTALHQGVVLSMIGVRYKCYCTNIIRTLMIQPAKAVTEAYNVAAELLQMATNELRDGVTFGHIYQLVEKEAGKHPGMAEKMLKNLGFVTGIEFRDSSLTLVAKSSVVAKRGMVVNLNIGFENLANPEAKSSQADKTFAIFLADTVLVNGEGEPATVLTPAKLKASANTIAIKEPEPGEGEEDEAEEPIEELLGRGHRRAIVDSKFRGETSEEKRAEKQAELFNKMLDDAKARLQGLSTEGDTKKATKSTVSYKGPGQMPKEADIQSLRLYTDKKYESVILPIFGQAVPFHISNIKNVSPPTVVGEYTYLRINFSHPGAPVSKEVFQDPGADRLKEVTFRARNERRPGEPGAPSNNLHTAYRVIKELQKKFRTREVEEKEMEDLVVQDSLQMFPKGRPVPKLKDLYIRPNIVSKRITGSLEAHINGFKFTSIRGDEVDILYNNIKHAIFQPSEGEMIILIHLHLKNPIMFAKKKHLDVQFYTEVGEISTDLGRLHNLNDRDELEMEAREKEMRKRLTEAFRSFIKRVEEVSKNSVEFDQPFRDLGFYGVPSRSTVFLQPTSGCLVEFVHFERVSLSIKNFDMVFVPKDYHKKPLSISSIPATSLDEIKNWLTTSCDIPYTEGIQTLNWAKVMKTVLEDPEGFFDQGGWSFLRPDNGEEEDSEEDGDEDEEYSPSEDDSEESEESEEGEESEDWDAEEEGSSSEELGSSEESGKDWDELEEEAQRHDREREREDIVQDHHRHRSSAKPAPSRPKKRHRSPSSSPEKKSKKSKKAKKSKKSK
uniref:FACT complex subunit n=1 Tax=Macrostomum lignano TaxID=282301 RepID=A0A1I8HE56_9PLAT